LSYLEGVLELNRKAGRGWGNKQFFYGGIMQKITSKDGTQIAFEKQGLGPALIMVDGALGFRSFSPLLELAKLLAPQFEVYNYDRRGRGDSGDARPIAVEREVEDIDALIQEAGGSAFLFGVSSGGVLALEAAIRLGSKVTKLAIYEAAYNPSDGAEKVWKEYTMRLAELLAADRRGDAVALFMNLVGVPPEQIAGMRQSPIWPVFESAAPSLAYDAAALGERQLPPTDRAARITAVTLVMNGSASYPFMEDTAKALARAIPKSQHIILEGQRHDASSEALAPVLMKFFKG
jgi:pimeloyl-ACP methyl ester carboxylesterase